jgi:hypothetical protein
LLGNDSNMLKKYAFLLSFCLFSTSLWAQLSCPNFKIRGNRSPRSNPFLTAIKFQFDGMAQYEGISPKYNRRLSFSPALSLGLEQTLHRKLSISAMHGWTFNPRTNNSLFISGDIRFYFDQCFENKWLSARVTYAQNNALDVAAKAPSFISIHYGKTARLKHIFTHYEMGIGFGTRDIIVLSFGAATGLKLN